jgi:hypothetical protein
MCIPLVSRTIQGRLYDVGFRVPLTSLVPNFLRLGTDFSANTVLLIGHVRLRKR